VNEIRPMVMMSRINFAAKLQAT